MNKEEIMVIAKEIVDDMITDYNKGQGIDFIEGNTYEILCDNFNVED
jgi:hypothetical protein